MKESAAARRAVLRIARSPSEAWDGVIHDWLIESARDAWQAALPTLVIVPTRAHALAFKARLLEERVSQLGVQFVTPALLRNLIFRERGDALLSRDDASLLLAIAAEETLAGRSTQDLDDEARAAKAVLRAPDHLLRTVDRANAAGWQFEQLQLRSFQPIVRRFHTHLRSIGAQLTADAERGALRQFASEQPSFGRVLATGFDGAHWPHWVVLRAAVNAAADAIVVLEYPQSDAETERCWIGSWEEVCGEALDVSSRASYATRSFFTDEEMRGLGRARGDYTFLVGSGTSEQAEAIAWQCVRFLAQPGCTRIGIVFAGAGALPRLVASSLAKLDVPHNDSFGHAVPGAFESPEWHAWLQLQRAPRIESLLQFVSALPNRADVFSNVSLEQLRKVLRAAHAEVLIDDLDLLQRFCARESEGSRHAVAEAIAAVRFLPTRATFREFLAETELVFDSLGWTAQRADLLRRIDDRVGKLDAQFSRTLFLRWLSEVATTFAQSRPAAGEHPYARVQLLTVEQAHGQQWSHVIFAGWNEGAWPPPATGEFMRESDIADFNRSIRALNRRAAREGSQGEGHVAIRENHSFYLGPAERRQIALRQFDSLLNSATASVAFSASLVQENTPERFWNPSELLTRIYQQTHREPLTQRAMSELQRATSTWLQTARALTKAVELPSVHVAQTRVAYDARRNAEADAGEYDFAFRSPPEQPPIFSVSEIEKLVSTPALIWMKKYLGAEANEDRSAWQSASGQWIHHWLGGVAGSEGSHRFSRIPNATEIDARVRDAAVRKIDDVKQLCASAGKTLPDWWTSGWQNTLCIARHLGSKLAAITDWSWMATEWKIEADNPISVDGAALSFRGRIDLLLARNAPDSDLATDELWIVDYKTGSNKALVAAKEDAAKRSTRLHNRLVKGEALQLGLYALAAQQRAAGEVFISILSRAIRNAAPQLSASDLAAHADVFAELARMQQTGVFGMLGQLRPAFGYAAPYPLATLAIDPDLLDAKWSRTHPALAREEEEIDW